MLGVVVHRSTDQSCDEFVDVSNTLNRSKGFAISLEIELAETLEIDKIDLPSLVKFFDVPVIFKLLELIISKQSTEVAWSLLCHGLERTHGQ